VAEIGNRLPIQYRVCQGREQIRVGMARTPAAGRIWLMDDHNGCREPAVRRNQRARSGGGVRFDRVIIVGSELESRKWTSAAPGRNGIVVPRADPEMPTRELE
jgi:hypothetical protein